MHIDFADKSTSKSISPKVSKYQFDTLNCSLEELAVLERVAQNPSIKQQELVSATVGFLYIRSGLKVMPYSDGGAQEFGLRAGTENVAGIVGMAVALKNNCDALEENVRYVEGLESKLVSMLENSGIKYVRNGGKSGLPGLISLSFPDADGEAILHRLDLTGICISTGSACNSKNTEISHVLQAIRLEDNYAKGTVRISLGKSNTEEDVEVLFKALMKIFRA